MDIARQLHIYYPSVIKPSIESGIIVENNQVHLTGALLAGNGTCLTPEWIITEGEASKLSGNESNLGSQINGNKKDIEASAPEQSTDFRDGLRRYSEVTVGSVNSQSLVELESR